jgi:hypothetical protein
LLSSLRLHSRQTYVVFARAWTGTHIRATLSAAVFRSLFEEPAMAKGQQRSNREAKKPKKAKAPAPVPAGSNRQAKSFAYAPGKPK